MRADLARSVLARSVLDPAVAEGTLAGAVGLVALGAAVEVVTAGSQDLRSRAPMRRDTIFRILSMTKPITAAAALVLVEEGRIALDSPVERWLPELADRRVLRTPESPLDDTVPARRPITLEDLLTLRPGIGWLQSGPLAAEMSRLGVAPAPPPVPFSPDEYIARIGQLPLADQPGERWLYHTGADILCVLLARVAGTSLPELLQTRLFDPLGMVDTGFHVSPAQRDRLATAYRRDDDGRLIPYEIPGEDAPPLFPSELLSTADDYLRFARMLLGRGELDGRRVLPGDSIGRMMRDHITPEQKQRSPFAPGFWERVGWGYGGAVVTRDDPGGPRPGSYGWDGGFGTSFTVDPAAETVTILLIQRMMRSADDTALAEAFRSAVYSTLELEPA